MSEFKLTKEYLEQAKKLLDSRPKRDYAYMRLSDYILLQKALGLDISKLL